MASEDAENFVVSYYEMLQKSPDIVHFCFRDDSTMLRIDGNTRKTATTVLEIMELVETLRDMKIEIKSKHSLESWNGGVLVTVWGSIHISSFTEAKKFQETFFLALHENEYIIHTDVFQYVDEKHIVQHPDVVSHTSNTQDDEVVQANAALTAPRAELPPAVEVASSDGADSVNSGEVTRLHIGNLPKCYDNAKVIELVREFACPVLVEVVRKKGKQAKVHAFVSMGSVEERDLVIANLNGKECGDGVLTASVARNHNPRTRRRRSKARCTT